MKTNSTFWTLTTVIASFFLPIILTAQSPMLRTHDVQGNGDESALIGQLVNIGEAVVTYANNSFAYIQDEQGDNDPSTSEGLLVVGGNTLQLVAGDRVQVSGTVLEIGNQTVIGNSPSITKLSGGTPLSPTPFLPTTQTENGVSPLERYEGMLLGFDIIASSGTDNFNSIDAYTTNNERPFREPGILPPGINGLPIFDGNPELFNYDPNGLGQANSLFNNAGDQITGVGILEEFNFGYELSPIEPTTLNAAASTRPVRPRTSEEITVGSLNTLFLLEDESDYQLRLTKNVNYIAELLEFPDVVALQEIGGQNELNDLIFRLRQLDPVRGNYSGFAPASNGFLNLGYLVHQRIEDPVYEELGGNEFFSNGGFLHNRNPLLVTFTLPGQESTNLQVLNLHIRSLSGVDDNFEVRLRRHEQAVSIANMVQNLRNDNLVVVGDYNAFQFTDGYVDVYNQISGLSSMGAQIEIDPIVSPPLNVAANSLVEAERYSFVFRGSAQQLDHCLYNDLTGIVVNDFAFARGNSDASINYANNAVQLPRASDHDGFVFYLQANGPNNTNAITTTNGIRLLHPNPIQSGQDIQYENLPTGATIILQNVAGQILHEYSFDHQGNQNGSFQLPNHLKSSLYFLSIYLDKRLLLQHSLLLR